MCLVCPLLYFCLSIHYLPVFTTSSKHCVQFNSLPACHQLLPLCSGGRAAEHLQREQGRTETEGKLDSTHTTSRSQAVIPILTPPRQEGKKQHGRVGMTLYTVHYTLYTVSLWPSISCLTLTLTLALECSRHCHHLPFLARCHWDSLYPACHTEGPNPPPPLEHALLGPALNPEPTQDKNRYHQPC